MEESEGKRRDRLSDLEHAHWWVLSATVLTMNPSDPEVRKVCARGVVIREEEADRRRWERQLARWAQGAAWKAVQLRLAHCRELGRQWEVHPRVHRVEPHRVPGKMVNQV